MDITTLRSSPTRVEERCTGFMECGCLSLMEHTAGFVIKRLMPYLGQSEAWWEKLLGVLAAGDRFIGVNRRHLRASDLGSALNCRMMGLTKDAVAADTMLRELVYKGT